MKNLTEDKESLLRQIDRTIHELITSPSELKEELGIDQNCVMLLVEEADRRGFLVDRAFPALKGEDEIFFRHFFRDARIGLAEVNGAVTYLRLNEAAKSVIAGEILEDLGGAEERLADILGNFHNWLQSELELQLVDVPTMDSTSWDQIPFEAVMLFQALLRKVRATLQSKAVLSHYHLNSDLSVVFRNEWRAHESFATPVSISNGLVALVPGGNTSYWLLRNGVPAVALWGALGVVHPDHCWRCVLHELISFVDEIEEVLGEESDTKADCPPAPEEAIFCDD